MYTIKLTKQAEKELKKLAKEDAQLFAEVNQKIKYLGEGKVEQLDIKPIRRKNKKNKILEIRIKYPSSYRVFYIEVEEVGSEILIVAGRRKKVDAFDDKYFRQLDKRIDNS
ncbi:ParE toxin of type II toxin-antitoxin system, parDE [Peptoclostridium litorale DSM 5388]|uniref:Uncharacterized protein n=1 Tax=Peptoclostridium litorale DSM 5388 TaxID=1121324 RepID=A0A069RL14_PEPLI|nr:type II toxin-antitoxin system RelE/ParE family toxin [Peptoclostridium litorale]KDR96805.1 hypothetical protein CLIT_20p00180 [Peptoclostridium litorale DSM 5388]SIO36356.1 ParE toxin of type II toxin-antitoxin system, parDE [Peptoclostridium litorale DSM 5388]